MTVDFQTIFGVQLGVEFADAETLEAFDMQWGLHIDLFIFRIVLTKWNN